MEHQILCRSCGNGLSDSEITQTVSYPSSQGDTVKYSLYRCPRCTFRFWWPMEQPPLVFYQKMYADFSWDDVSLEFPEVDLFLKVAHGLSGKLLDIGCGSGAFLYQLKIRRAPFDLWGIDLLPAAVKRIQESLGVKNVFASSLGDFASGTEVGTFDLVTAFNVVEHAGDPVPFFKNVKKLLKKGGSVLFVVPDADRYSAWGRMHNVAPNQFTWWNRKSLEALLKTQGFQDVLLEPMGYEPAIDLVMGWATSLGLVKRPPNFNDYNNLSSTDLDYHERKSGSVATKGVTVRKMAKRVISWGDYGTKMLGAVGIGRNHFMVKATLG